MLDSLIRSLISYLDKWSFGVKEKILFFKELGHLLQWGVGMAESLDILRDNTDNFAIKELATTLRDQINQWRSLSHSLLKFPQYFDDADIATLQSGEKSWNLASMLGMISSEYSFLNTLKGKFIGALTYPAILMTISLGAIIALFIFVLPAIFDIASQFNGTELPWITIQLKAFSDFLTMHRIGLIGTIVFLSFAWFVFFSTQSGQVMLYEMLYNIPVIGRMIQSYYLVRFARYAKILLGSGMNYRDVFKMLKNVIAVPIFTPLFDRIIAGLERGESIHQSLQYDTMLIPSNVSALIKVGEQTANLGSTFDTIIAIHQEELEHYINNLSKIIEPVMLVIVGSVIIMIALGVFGVIMNIMDNVGM